MNKRLSGILAILICVALYGSYGVFSRLISPVFHTFSQEYVRDIITLIIFGYIFFSRKARWKHIKKSDRKWFAGWTISGSIVMLLLFNAFNALSLGTAYFLFYSTMIITGFIMGRLLFGERLNIVKIISLLCAMVGLYIVYSVSINVHTILFIVYALIAGACTGAYNVFSKKISGKYSPYQMMSISTLTAAIIALIGSFITHESVPALTSNSAWIWICLFSIVSITASYFLIQGFKYLDAQLASIILPLEVLFASIYGFVLYHESLSHNVMLGGLMIICAALLPEVVSVLKRKQKHTGV